MKIQIFLVALMYAVTYVLCQPSENDVFDLENAESSDNPPREFAGKGNRPAVSQAEKKRHGFIPGTEDKLCRQERRQRHWWQVSGSGGPFWVYIHGGITHITCSRRQTPYCEKISHFFDKKYVCRQEYSTMWLHVHAFGPPFCPFGWCTVARWFRFPSCCSCGTPIRRG